MPGGVFTSTTWRATRPAPEASGEEVHSSLCRVSRIRTPDKPAGLISIITTGRRSFPDSHFLAVGGCQMETQMRKASAAPHSPWLGAGRGQGRAQGGTSMPSRASTPCLSSDAQSMAPGVVNTARGVSGPRAAAEGEFRGEGREHQRRDLLSGQQGIETSHPPISMTLRRPDSWHSPRAGLPCPCQPAVARTRSALTRAGLLARKCPGRRKGSRRGQGKCLRTKRGTQAAASCCDPAITLLHKTPHGASSPSRKQGRPPTDTHRSSGRQGRVTDQSNPRTF